MIAIDFQLILNREWFDHLFRYFGSPPHQVFDQDVVLIKASLSLIEILMPTILPLPLC